MSTVKVFVEQRCPTCGRLFQPVDWMPARVKGFCHDECDPEWIREQQRKREALKARKASSPIPVED